MKQGEQPGVVLVVLLLLGHCRPPASALYSPRADGGRRSIDESVAQTDDRFDLPSRLTELAAEAADMDIYRAGFHQALVAPDPLEQPVPGHNAIFVLNEISEEFE